MSIENTFFLYKKSYIKMEQKHRQIYSTAIRVGLKTAQLSFNTRQKEDPTLALGFEQGTYCFIQSILYKHYAPPLF